MINLARHIDRNNPQVDPVVHEQVKLELSLAGIEILDHRVLLNVSSEVPSSAAGMLCGWTFRRAWKYWIAEGPGVPSDKALEFNRTWETTVRVGGFAGGHCPVKMCHGFGVSMYHIDTQEGLNAFTDLLRSIYVEVP